MKRNNQGLTLVELLVALAIMSVLGTMLTLTMNVVPKNNAKACANGLKTVIGQTRIQTMGKRETVLELSRDVDGNLYTVTRIDSGSGLKAQQKELCGKSNVKISYHMMDGTDPAAAGCAYADLADSETWMISFDRSTGKELKGGPSSSSGVCDGIKVKGGGAVYLIRIYPLTGKVTLDRVE